MNNAMENNEPIYSEEIQKVMNQKNEDCQLLGTEECAFLNMKNCESCPVGKLKPEARVRSAAALNRLLSTVPEERIAPLMTSEWCCFCDASYKEPAECYAFFDLAKPDPEGDWTVALGKKKLSVKGADMILPLQVACCKKCRDAYRLFDWLPPMIGLIIAALGLYIVTGTPLYKTLYLGAAWLPFAVTAAIVVLAFCVHCLLKMILASALRKRMFTDVADIPIVKELLNDGFYEVAQKKFGVSKLVFSNTRREHGIYSREIHEEPHVCGIWPAEVPPETAKTDDDETAESAEIPPETAADAAAETAENDDAAETAKTAETDETEASPIPAETAEDNNDAEDTKTDEGVADAANTPNEQKSVSEND